MFERMHSQTQNTIRRNAKYIKFARGDAVPQTAAATQSEVECHTNAESKNIDV